MLQTYIKKPLPSKTILLALFAAIGLSSVTVQAEASQKPLATKVAKKQATGEADAPMPGVVSVSDYEFNTFTFPSPIKRVLFPGGSPVVGKPIYLGDNDRVMLQFAKSNGKPVQMVVELNNGTAVTIRVVPKAIPGVTHEASGVKAKKAVSQSSTAKSTSGDADAPKGADIELLKTVVSSGEAPSGFEPVKLTAPTRFDKFTVVPLSGWSDGERRVFVFSLVAAEGHTAVVSPPQFYRQGITAVMLDGDVVDADHSPQLYVVEEVSDE